ncbi:MAG TPA: cytochrome c [Terriglobales bacterium]
MRRTLVWLAIVMVCVAVGAWTYKRDAEVKHGERAFQESGCGACHLTGGAPSLQNVGKRLDRKMMKRLITNPDDVYLERGMQSLNAGYPRMPKPGAKDADVDAIVSYLETLKD